MLTMPREGLSRYEFLVSPDAALLEQGIDLLADGLILLHLKPRASQDCLVVNRMREGRWDRELWLPLPADFRERPFRLRLCEEGQQVLLQLGEAERIAYPHALSLRQANGLRLPHTVQERIPGAPPGEPAARIHWADMVHLCCVVQDLPLEDARLVVTADGRPSAALALGPGIVPETGQLRIFHEPGSLVLDEMEVELLLDHGGERRLLARHVVASRFLGAIEQASEAQVQGWACNPACPGQRVMVDVFLNGVFQGAAAAEIPRPDLAALNGGQENCGFLFRFPRTVFLPKGAEASVTVRIQDTTFALANSPWWLARRTVPEGAELVMPEAP